MSQRATPPLASGKVRGSFALAIHGGAGVLSRQHMTPETETEYREALKTALQTGYDLLEANSTGIEAVSAAVKVLEDSPLFNAGRGAVLNRAGEAELDAAIMDGLTRTAGAIAAVKHIRNPIELARMVMERSPHVLLVGEGAEVFAREQGMGLVPQDYFITEARKLQLDRIQHEQKSGRKRQSLWHEKPAPDRFGTVGAVALDKHGNLAAGTSTGGIANKQPGRVGDSPIIGAGTYANNSTCAVSATGHGEFFIRAVVAHDISALMDYGGLSLNAAADRVVKRRLVDFGGEGGVIAVDCKGNIAMPFNSHGMYRGVVREDGRTVIEIY